MSREIIYCDCDWTWRCELYESHFEKGHDVERQGACRNGLVKMQDTCPFRYSPIGRIEEVGDFVSLDLNNPRDAWVDSLAHFANLL